MDQQDRLAKVMRPRRDIDERDLDPIRRETPELGGAAQLAVAHGPLQFPPPMTNLAPRTEND